MAEGEHKKIKHPLCPKCGKPMRVIVPINMAVCDECGEKYYIEKQGDEFVVLGKYYETKASKVNETKQEDTDWINGHQKEKPKKEQKEKTQEPAKEEPQKGQENISEEQIIPPVMPTGDSRVAEYRDYVEKYVVRRFWLQVAKDELKRLVSEMYDAGALGNGFNPSRVARILTDIDSNTIIPFYGVEWLDVAVTKELLTRIWLKLQGYKEVMKIEKLKYYIAIFHPDDMEEFLSGKLSEIKVKKYIYEMEAIDA